jgi:tRNA pseudouridine55 synthase
MQVPPAYSAKRSGGERLYDLARRGIAVERAPVAVVVHSLEVVALDGDRLELAVRCEAGTYVRALARDVGEALGTGAHLVALRRTRSGGFGEADAVSWAEVARRGREAVVPLEALLLNLPAVTVTTEGRAALRHGRDLSASLLVGDYPSASGWIRVLDGSGALVALAVPRPGTASAELPVASVLHPDIVLLDTAGASEER